MNKTKISMLFVVALLLSQPTQVKGGIFEVVGLCAMVAAATYAYLRHNENNKDELIKIIDSGTNKAKDRINKVAEDAKDMVKKA